MKNILLLVHDDEGQEARLQAALDLTRALGGHLRCVDVTPLIVVAGDMYVGIGQGAVLVDERESEARNKERLTARLAKEDVPWDWIDVTGEFASCLLKEASLADVVVLNRQLDQFPLPDMRMVTSQVLMHARVPVLAVPQTLERFNIGRAVLAWDGRQSCIATMRASAPLLALADEVEVLTIHDGSIEAAPADSARYLSRHGVDATIRSINDRLHPIEVIIEEECARFRADYLVMGAYGRGRLMETFGGVTKRLLTRSKYPLLLGH
ncbi:universal stress protein [Sphingobium chlorophenolicum]|uniref:UspA n=1 Tax=Sphingobium chlorophenolicum TaxID=46429 RepID=A0A081RCK5_SPHCR|nr:universal stress protein [Sphingobium chlorophenolicum]KEQ52928.1 UspA [Sphingobium chlorophenolicum]